MGCFGQSVSEHNRLAVASMALDIINGVNEHVSQHGLTPNNWEIRTPHGVYLKLPLPDSIAHYLAMLLKTEKKNAITEHGLHYFKYSQISRSKAQVLAQWLASYAISKAAQQTKNVAALAEGEYGLSEDATDAKIWAASILNQDTIKCSIAKAKDPSIERLERALNQIVG